MGGGHLVFIIPQNKKYKHQVKVPLALGVEADICVNQDLRFWGESREVHGCVNLNELNELPASLHPIHKKTSPIIVKNLIKEGERNITIFKWMVKKHSFPELAYLIGGYLCQPPLGESECEILSNAKNRTNESSHQQETADLYLSDINTMVEVFVGKLAYDNSTNVWYQVTGKYWNKVQRTIISRELCRFILNNPEKFKRKIPASSILSFVKENMELLSMNLPIEKEWRDYPVGLNFNNGYLEFSTGNLCVHSYKRFEISVLKVDYKPGKGPTQEVRKFLLDFGNYDTHFLFLIKTMLYRALIPMEELQTAYSLSGPPGCGKSTLVRFMLAMMSALKCISLPLTDVENPFTRSELREKTCIIFSEESEIKPAIANVLRKLIGRDVMKGDIKFEQMIVEFVHKGIVILVSNETPEDLFANSTALLNRFFCINFKTVPETPDPNINTIFEENMSEIVNWV